MLSISSGTHPVRASNLFFNISSAKKAVLRGTEIWWFQKKCLSLQNWKQRILLTDLAKKTVSLNRACFCHARYRKTSNPTLWKNCQLPSALRLQSEDAESQTVGTVCLRNKDEYTPMREWLMESRCMSEGKNITVA